MTNATNAPPLLPFAPPAAFLHNPATAAAAAAAAAAVLAAGKQQPAQQHMPLNPFIQQLSKSQQLDQFYQQNNPDLQVHFLNHILNIFFFDLNPHSDKIGNETTRIGWFLVIGFSSSWKSFTQFKICVVKVVIFFSMYNAELKLGFCLFLFGATSNFVLCVHILYYFTFLYNNFSIKINKKCFVCHVYRYYIFLLNNIY